MFIFILLDLNIDLANFVVFIDEMVAPDLDDLIGVYIKLLRNLCRAVHIPVILSGTNSRVQNLVGQTDIAVSRRGEFKPWVKVVTLLPKATLESFGHFIKFAKFNNQTVEYTLNDFLNARKTDLKYAELFRSLINMSDFGLSDQKNLQKLFKFVIKQSHTNLPGLAIITCKVMIDLIVELRENVRIDCEAIWKRLINEVTNLVIDRKGNISKFEGKLASLHILTFPSKIKTLHELGHNAGKKVNSHLFYFGRSNEEGIFVLEAGRTNSKSEVVFRRNNLKWTDHCFFPKLSLDFFAHMVSWNSINENAENPTEIETAVKTEIETVAAIYSKYLTDVPHFIVESIPTVSDFFKLELLAHWTICNASHFNVNGYTKGVDAVKEFVKNLQVVGDLETVTFGYVNDFPPSLKIFLARVSVPYLVTPEAINAPFSNQLSGLTRFGKSWRPKNKVGWDVIFNAFLDEKPNNCLIECKLWEKSIGLSMIHKYYKRACDLKSSLSFLVCSNFNQSLEKVFEDVTDLDLEAEGPLLPDPTDPPISSLEALDINIEDLGVTESISESITVPNDTEKSKSRANVAKKAKTVPTTPIPTAPIPVTVETFNQLWTQVENHINIYTVRPIIDGTFVSLEYKVIKEHPAPTGVFIITQSLFKPPPISSHSA